MAQARKKQATRTAKKGAVRGQARKKAATRTRKQKQITQKKEGIYYGYDLCRSSGTGNRYLW